MFEIKTKKVGSCTIHRASFEPLSMHGLESNQAGEEILRVCVDVGGSLTGEHGIGFEKIGAMNWLFDDVALDLMRRVRETFDPTGLCNPGKVVPTPGRCSDVRKTFGAKRYA